MKNTKIKKIKTVDDRFRFGVAYKIDESFLQEFKDYHELNNASYQVSSVNALKFGDFSHWTVDFDCLHDEINELEAGETLVSFMTEKQTAAFLESLCS